MKEWEMISECVIKGDHNHVGGHVEAALEQGAPPETILHKGLLKGMEVIGERFRKDECFIPEVLVAARAMHAGLAILKPILTQSAIKTLGTIVIGTVKGDLHDIGKNIVSMMFEGAGFSVIDLGVDVPPQKFVDEIRNSQASVLALSALLTTTIQTMANTIALVREAEIGDRVKIMVGGAPVNQNTANKMGADGYGENAVEAVTKAKQLLALD